MEKITLKGGCFVLAAVYGEGNTDGGSPLSQVIGTTTGSLHLSQFRLSVKEGQSPQNSGAGQSPIYSFGQSDVLLFVIDGHPQVTISGKTFEAAPEAGLYVRPGEAFQITPSPQSSPTRGEEAHNIPSPLMGEGQNVDNGQNPKALSLDGRGLGEGDSLRMLVTVCPEAEVQQLDAMPTNFDETFPDRLVAPDASLREEMGERYYQVLVGKKQGSEQVTQFIGKIPKSKAPSHHHLYEEALYVLSGEGFMWTGDMSAPVSPGSIIFLPKKQEHSLECTSDAGLRVAGHFYPAGSPAENY